jgi:acyl-CoA hydrolase
VTRPEVHTDPEPLVDRILAETGGDIVLGLPLGLGKANTVVNALFARARADRSIRLRIFTALTLEPPEAKSDLEHRFLDPINERLFAGYPPLAYAEAQRAGDLPPNVEVSEFFLQAGRWLGNGPAQRSYISANYTHAARYLIERGVNVIAQLVSPEGDRLSLSCNSDITLDILDTLRFRGGRALLVGQTNAELPFMPGPAALPATAFDLLLTGHDFPLFAPPHMAVSAADHAIGLRCAALVPDGGSIQIGIGSIGDAFGAALIMRHEAPALFRDTLARLGGPAPHTEPFATGLYGISEMLVPAFLALYRAGVLKRPAADGALVHAGFFLGPRGFYAALRGLPDAERARFQMREISFVNALYGGEADRAADRRDARFVNNAMLATLLGDVTSDGLDDGRIVSGVGGQHDFVTQAFALPGARAIIALNATREEKGETVSNLVWSYGHTTIPRHLRDILVTEYGTADLRGRADRDCVAATLSLADARFRAGLLRQARDAGKVEPGFALPDAIGTPHALADALAPARAEGRCTSYPFGTDLTEAEQKLAPALARLKALAGRPRRLAAAAVAGGPDRPELLARLGLAEPSGVRERALRRLVLNSLDQQHPSR